MILDVLSGTTLFAGVFLGLLLGIALGPWLMPKRWGQAKVAERLQTLIEERDRLVALLQKREVVWTGWPKAGERTWTVVRNEVYDVRSATVLSTVMNRWPATDSLVRVNFAIVFPREHGPSERAILRLKEGDTEVWTCGSVRNVTGQNADCKVLVEEAIARARVEMDVHRAYRMIFQVQALQIPERPEVRFIEVPFLASTGAEPDADQAAQAVRQEEAARIAAALEVDPDLAEAVEHARHRTSS